MKLYVIKDQSKDKAIVCAPFERSLDTHSDVKTGFPITATACIAA